jgi:hypothetical protein
VILTGMQDPIDRILGLELGADDYIHKTAMPREILARIRAVLRRARPAAAAPLAAAAPAAGKWAFQVAERELYREKTDLELKHPGAPIRANAVTDVPRSRDYPVLLRGENANKGDIVPRRFLEILSTDPKKRPVWNQGSGRLQLAQAITDVHFRQTLLMSRSESDRIKRLAEYFPLTAARERRKEHFRTLVPRNGHARLLPSS